MANLLDALCERLRTSLDRQGRAHVVCPWCGAEPRFHFYIYQFRNGKSGAVCWSCGYRATLRQLADALDVQGDERPVQAPRELPPAPVAPWATDDALSRYRHAMGQRWPAVVAAWQAYKPLSEQSIRSADLGLGKLPLYDEAGDRWYESRYPRLLYPLIEGGRIVGIAGRAYLPEDTGPKWLTGSCSTLILHGLDTIEPGDTVIWVENRVDRLLVLEERPDVRCLASGGLTWRPEWLEAIAARRPRAVLIWFDNDVSGCPSAAEYIRGKAAWLARMQAQVKAGKIKQVPPFQEPRGLVIANALLERGVKASVYQWANGTPEHQDIGTVSSVTAVLDRALAHLTEPAPEVVTTALPEAPKERGPIRRGLKKVARVHHLEPELTVDELPAMIHKRVAEYLAEPAPGYALLLALPAGSGKTTALVQTAEQHASGAQRVIYAGPRHDFFLDIQAIAQRPHWWYEWQPRHGGTDTLEATCRWAPQMERWLARGYQAIEMCRNARICGWDYLKHDCPYHAQRAITQPIIFAQHQHVAIKHPLMEQASLLIGDELPLTAFLHHWIIPPASITLDSADAEIHGLLYKLRELTTLAAPRKGGWSGPQLMAEIGGAAYVADLCERYSLMSDSDLISPHLSDPYDVDKAEYAHLPVLLSLLKQEANAGLRGLADYVRRVKVNPEGLHLLMRRRPGHLPAHIVWCDATGNADVYQRLLGMPVEVIRPRVKMAGTIYQVWSSLNNKYQLRGLTDHTDEQKQARARKGHDLKAQIDHILSKGYQKPAVISYKDLLDELAPEVQERGHFGAERGTNRLAECDCLIVVGTPMPPQPDLLEAAAMLYDDQQEPFNMEWSVTDRQFYGTDQAYPIGGYWGDSRLQSLVDQFREAELMQAVHRARPLRREVDVYLLTNAAVPGLPVTLTSLHQLFDAPEGVDPYRWPGVRAWVRERLAQVGSVTASEIAERAGVQWAAGRRYLEALAAQDGYQVRKVKQDRGKPALALVKGLPCPD